GLAVGIAVGQVQSELERLARVPGQVQKVEKRDALRVVDQHRLSPLVHLQPAGRGPTRDGREDFGRGIVREGPEVQAYRRADVDPRQPAIGKARLRHSDGVAGGQVTVV